MGRTRDRATTFMNAIVSAFGTESVSLPARRFVSFARLEEEADSPTGCAVEQLSVHVHHITGGLPSFASDVPLAPRQTVRTIELAVRVARCVPVITDQGNSPSVGSIESAVDVMAADVDALNLLAATIVGGSVFGDCIDVTVGSVRNLGVAGDMHAVGLTVQVQF